MALFSTIAGLVYGAWVDGASLWSIAALVVGFLGALSAALWLANERLARKHA